MEKNSLAKFCDAHFHLIPSEDALNGEAFCFVKACTAAHSVEEFNAQEKRVKEINENNKGALIQSFGLHPQNPILQNLEFLEGLLAKKSIQAIGECGLDFFTKEFSEKSEEQNKAFLAQLEFAEKYQFPLVIHARKAMQEIFECSDKIKKAPAVIFHSFSGTPSDAKSLLSKGINAYFSFGKPLMNGAKKALTCVRTLPLERLLLETDAPYQTLKGELVTSPNEISDVYQSAWELRAAGIPFEARPPFYDFVASIENNFNKAFCLF